jgi:uncharacterized protein with ATP-grasp and redox domains
MDLQLDCLACILRQVVESSRMASDDKETHEKIMDEVLTRIAGYKNYKSAPALTREILSVVSRHTGVSDLYAEVKNTDIREANEILPRLREFLNQSDDKLYWALKIAATGNVIDRAINHAANNVEALIEKEIKRKFAVDDYGIFREKIAHAQNILVIGDNAGESVFDRILIENLPGKNFTYAVRSGPVLNDVTLEDAVASGLDKCASIISSGCDSPGAILEECSPEFLDVFWGADLVISKGQGNFEMLSGCGREMFFLLKLKCVAISAEMKIGLNEYILRFEEGK